MTVPDDRCKTPEDRKQFMARLLDLWHRNPDLRFGQLLSNYFEDDPYHLLYNIEDLVLLSRLEGYYRTD